MATQAANQASLQTAYEQVIARIVEVTASANPDYSIAGRSFSKGAYLAQLTQQLKSLKEAIAIESGPYEIRSRGV